MVRFVTASDISKQQIIQMEYTIKEYFFYRKRVFPSAGFLPKHHYVFHYAEQMIRIGPLAIWWTLYFERKHQFLKYHATHSKNFINLPLLVCEREQLYQASLYGDRFSSKIKCNKLQITESLPHGIAKSFKFKSKFVFYNNIKFSQGDLIAYKIQNNTR